MLTNHYTVVLKAKWGLKDVWQKVSEKGDDM